MARMCKSWMKLLAKIPRKNLNPKYAQHSLSLQDYFYRWR